MAPSKTTVLVPSTPSSTIISDRGLGAVPRKRGHGYWTICLVIAIVAYALYITVIVARAFTKSKGSPNKTASGPEEAPKPGDVVLEKVAVLLIAEMATLLAIYVYRLVRFGYEWKLFYSTRYNSDMQTLFDATMRNGKGDLVAVFLFFGGLAVLIYFVTSPSEAVKEMLASILGAVSISSLTSILLGLTEPTRAERSETLEGNNYNISTGMAWNYYTGYLKLILDYKPNNADHHSLPNALMKSSLENVMSSLKLFLLVPDDCNCAELVSWACIWNLRFRFVVTLSAWIG